MKRSGKRHTPAASETGIPSYYLLKRPSEKDGRKRWSLLLVSRTPAGRKLYQSVINPLLDNLNTLWEKGFQSFDQLDKQAIDLRERLNRELKGKPGGVVFNQENMAILGDFNAPNPGTYWHDVYGRRKRLIDRRSSYYELRRSLEAVGNLSLTTATEQEIQAAIDGHGYPDNKQRRIVSRLQPLLEFIGRKEIKLEKARPEQREVRYLTVDEFNAVLKHVEEPWLKTLSKMAFYSGLRQGELFGVKPEEISEGQAVVNVRRQLDPKLKFRPTKTRAIRKAFLFPEGGDAYREWFELPQEEVFKHRLARIAELFRDACIKAFPKRPDKWCTFHDLRHSYAIRLLEKGVPLSFVARSLGNSEVVCEQHYTGKVLTDGFIEGIKAFVKA